MFEMSAGLTDQIGAPLDVNADPKTIVVAEFIGSPATDFLPETAAVAAQLGIRPEQDWRSRWKKARF